MKALLVKLLQKRNGLFDRELVVDILETKTVLRYFLQRYYRKLLKSLRTKPIQKRSIHALERMALAFEPIGFLSRFKSFFRKTKKQLKLIIA